MWKIAGSAFYLRMTLPLARMMTPTPAACVPWLALSFRMAHIAPMGDSGKSRQDELGRELESLRDPLIGYFRRRVRDQQDCADLVQEVFLRLSTRGDALEIENLRGYVFQVAASVLADRQRRRAVRMHDAHVELDPERVGEPEIAPDRIVAGREALRTVMTALEQLPDRTRTIFVLRRLEGMRYRDIANRLGVSVSAVEKHMVHAVAQLSHIGDVR